jgi:SAM-dependent methyltransferase
MSTYVLRGGSAGAERLRLLARIMEPTTLALFERVGLAEGMSCLDAGCGIGAVTLALARRVGPGARVVGIDFDERVVELAREEAERQGLPVVFRPGSVHDLDEESAYDLVYARFLLSHLDRPAEGLARLVRAARPGSLVVVEDVDFAGHFCYPPCPAFDSYQRLYTEVVRRRGGDACLGPRLPGLLDEAGLEGVDFALAQPAFRRGEGKRLAAVTMEHIREAVLAAGLATAAEVDRTALELEELACDPRSLVSLPRIFQAWGSR